MGTTPSTRPRATATAQLYSRPFRAIAAPTSSTGLSSTDADTTVASASALARCTAPCRCRSSIA